MLPEDRERFERVLAEIPDACNLGELLGHLRLANGDGATHAVLPTMRSRASIDRASAAERELIATKELLHKARIENERLRVEKNGLIAGVEKARKEGESWRGVVVGLRDEISRLQSLLDAAKKPVLTPPVVVECQVCATIKRMVLGPLGVESAQPRKGRATGVGKLLLAGLQHAPAPIGVNELARVLGLDARSVGQNLQYLVRKKRVRRIGFGPGVQYVIAATEEVAA